jgi:hypothetical protein
VRSLLSEDLAPLAARLFMTCPYTLRVCVTSIRFEMATSHDAGET